MTTSNHNTLIEDILEHARWAPSGDNMQTWRFESKDKNHFIIHGYDTREHCVYDLQGHASQLAIGALIESIAISASNFGHVADFLLRHNSPATNPTIDVTLSQNSSIKTDPLFAYLPTRSVQRRPYKTTPLTDNQIAILEKSVEKNHNLTWVSNGAERWKVALLMFKNGKLRLTLPEAFFTHSTIIEWDDLYSNDKIPAQAIGLDPIATRLMKWALQSWKRIKFLNTYLAGTLLPRIELDLLPSYYCAAHFILVAKQAPKTTQDYLDAGRSLQRFWLTATQLNLQIQPEMTPLIFHGYIKQNIKFTEEKKITKYAQQLSNRFENLFGKNKIQNAVFIGRIGSGKASYSRSLRLSVNKLFISPTAQQND